MIFRFRQFEVKHSDSLLKVGTDAVLLGSLLNEENIVASLLDIGSGCGVIALMAAQKFPEATIQAIEIDEASCKEALFNFKNSRFSARLNAIAVSLQQFKPNSKFDLIISNPPYFETPDFAKGNNPQDIQESRKKAATQFSLTTDELISYAAGLLNVSGTFQVIIPYLSKDKFIALAKDKNLHLHREIFIKSKPETQWIRSVLSFGFDDVPVISSALTIYNTDGTRSEEYAWITQEYYL